MATPKKPTPKVKITGSASGRAATGTKSVTRGGSMAQSPKIVEKKSTPKAKPKLTKSERDFLAGQKLKAKITKKTGVYPNTAN
jgi:hypothetical protein